MIKRFVLFMLLLASGCAVQKPPTLTPFADGEYWVLDNDMVYEVRKSGYSIVVPRGFVTDFASVPRIFWTIFPRHGEYTRAAIVHDYLYWQQQCTRQQADELFDIIMEDSHVDSATRLTIYAAVRVWGDEAWENNSEAKKQGYLRIIPERYMDFPLMTRWDKYREYIRTMSEIDAPQEVYPNIAPPAYCSALEKPAETDETEPASAPSEEPAEQPEPAAPVLPVPQQPVPESALGA